MMPNRFASVLMASLLGSAPAALAQAASAPSTTVAPVTVQAAPTPKVIEQQSRNFVQSHAAAPNPEVDQIGRWRDAVCVQVEGLPPEQAAVIKARIESVAKAVGLPAARAGCKANVEIVFNDQPQAVMDSVAKRHESLLGYSHRHETNRLKTVSHPIQAWYVSATRGGAGDVAGILFANFWDGPNPLPRVIPEWLQMHTGVIDDPDNEPPLGCGANPHFTACLKSVFSNVFMVADSKALEGKDLGLVADDMVILALSQPKSLDGCNALPSVIDRFAKSACPGRDPPDGLTPADAAYLTALYASDPEGKMWTEQGDIARRMAKMLISGNSKHLPADANGP